VHQETLMTHEFSKPGTRQKSWDESRSARSLLDTLSSVKPAIQPAEAVPQFVQMFALGKLSGIAAPVCPETQRRSSEGRGPDRTTIGAFDLLSSGRLDAAVARIPK
jgi:hypothetical protein